MNKGMRKLEWKKKWPLVTVEAWGRRGRQRTCCGLWAKHSYMPFWMLVIQLVYELWRSLELVDTDLERPRLAANPQQQPKGTQALSRMAWKLPLCACTSELLPMGGNGQLPIGSGSTFTPSAFGGLFRCRHNGVVFFPQQRIKTVHFNGRQVGQILGGNSGAEKKSLWHHMTNPKWNMFALLLLNLCLLTFSYGMYHFLTLSSALSSLP